MNKNGFTLAEVIVVVAILSILGSVAVPLLLRTAPNLRLREGAREVYLALQQARMEAVKRNTPVTVQFTEASCAGGVPSRGGSYRIFFSDAGGTERNITGNGFPADVALCSGKGSMASAQFRPNGIPTAGGKVVLTNSYQRNTYAVLSLTGAIRLSDTDPAGP